MSLVSRFIIILFFIPLLSHAQINRALFVGIDKYPKGSGWEWQDIHGTNDSSLIIPMLFKQGYHKENIKILMNEKATKKMIIYAITDIYKDCEKGDYIYIHFSCHGQQMIDNDGDEEDGLDEALITYDAHRVYVKGKYEGENHLRDDELGKYLELIRAKVGSTGNITVVLDACHSGTGTRIEDEDEYIRGTSYIFGPKDVIAKSGDPNKLRFSHKIDKSLSHITIFSACLDKEINHEYKDFTSGIYYGSLSYALCKILSSNVTKLSTKKLFDTLTKEMNNMFAKKKWDQTPYYETTNSKKNFRLGK